MSSFTKWVGGPDRQLEVYLVELLVEVCPRCDRQGANAAVLRCPYSEGAPHNAPRKAAPDYNFYLSLLTIRPIKISCKFERLTFSINHSIALFCRIRC